MAHSIQDSGANTAPLGLPSIPFIGWETVTEDNHQDIADKIPRMMTITLIHVELPNHTKKNLSLQELCMLTLRRELVAILVRGISSSITRLLSLGIWENRTD